jgi:hypothetical protein
MTSATSVAFSSRFVRRLRLDLHGTNGFGQMRRLASGQPFVFLRSLAKPAGCSFLLDWKYSCSDVLPKEQGFA